MPRRLRPRERPGQPSTLDATCVDLGQALKSVARAQELRGQLHAARQLPQRDRRSELAVMQDLIGQVDLGRRFLEEVMERHEKEAKL